MLALYFPRPKKPSVSYLREQSDMIEDCKDRIRSFLSQHLGGRSLGDSDDIFASGFVNSLFAMQIVLFLEKEFKVTLESDDLELPNFRTIEAMSSLILRKQSAT
jgi:methoxymalonate biosynthesis acyl carrier protein